MTRLAPLLVLLAACGPVPVEQAERACLQDARLAQRPRGELGIAVGSGGRVRVGGQIDVSSDFLLGRDPSDVFARCVLRRSGQMPTRPLSAMPGWEG
jgi:hypothetical protein